MFDIGFTELLLCLVVALVVIGPEQLPGTVRTVALWIGRLKRSLAETRSEIERQIGADDIRRQLHNEEILRNIEETRLQLEASLREHGVLEDQSNPVIEHQRSASDYGPPDELPDHAHHNDDADNQKPAAKSNPVATSTGNAQHAASQSNTNAPTPHNNQQSPTAAPVVTNPSTGAGQ